MNKASIRQSGDSKVITIPNTLLKSLNLETGSEVELSIENGKIILSPIIETFQYQLDDLLKTSTKATISLPEEDKQWLNSPPEGKEEF